MKKSSRLKASNSRKYMPTQSKKYTKENREKWYQGTKKENQKLAQERRLMNEYIIGKIIHKSMTRNGWQLQRQNIYHKTKEYSYFLLYI